MLKIILIIFLLFEINFTISANILAVFPYPSVSHQVVFQPLIKKLVMLEHNVTVITPYPQYKKEEAPYNIKEIDVQDVSYKIYQKIFTSNLNTDKRNSLIQLKFILKISSEVFEGQMLNEQVQELIKEINNDFDIILVEAFLKMCLGFSHVFKGPIIQISSLGATPYNQESYGIPDHPILYPPFWNRRIYNLTIFEKVTNLHTNLWRNNIRDEHEMEENKKLKNIFGPDTPNINELRKNVDMLFLNIHPIFVDNQPLPPNVIYVGGIHIKPIKELPKDLQKVLDSSKNGVIYFSMGSNIKMSQLPTQTIEMFIKTFSSLPYDILWKCDEDILRIKSENIKIFKWFPQSDLLAHPKVKLFITQGGLQSTDEAINAGVPLIGIPMVADQWYNVEKYVYHKIGLKLDISMLTEESLTNAIKTVISNSSYRENIFHLRALMQDQKEQPLKRAVRWIEFTLRQGGAKHMRASAANLTWHQYYEIEIIFTVFAVITIILGFVYFIIKNILKFLVEKVKLS